MDSWLVTNSWMLLALPLASFLGGIAVGPLKWQLSAAWSVLCNLAGAAWAIGLAAVYLQTVAPGDTAGVVPWSWTWFDLHNTALGETGLRAGIGAYLDPISVMMLVVVASISALVHIYSVGYMRHDKAAGRFFPLLSFFVFSMQGLVLAADLLQMFIFWELVGVSSYLLIGFWHHKPSAVAASKKAFIITRFADAFFLTGIIITALVIGSLDFTTINDPGGAAAIDAARITVCGLPLLSIATICLFTGGWGKSAMFPLHVWLPDAMEGPTPVSSIIHSATMVVAGVFLTARLFPLFAAADGTLLLVEVTGAFTALFAAAIACVQLDIKRILAFSTLSQLGYMMFAIGVADPDHPAGYTASMFHVFTHAWFKCLLFLGAGLVIHVAHDNSLAQMGGLRRKLPLTWLTCLIACLAIAGFPFTAGWFSKDAILMAAWTNHHPLSFAVGLGVGALTAYYMFRYFILIFHGTFRGQAEHFEHAHEDTLMVLPMLILAVPSLIAGWLANDLFAARVIPPHAEVGEHDHPVWVVWAASAAGIIGILAAILIHGRQTTVGGEPRGLRRLLANKFYIDEAYLWVVHRLIFRRLAEPAKWCDDKVVDGALHGSADSAQAVGAVVRFLQNGQIHRYLIVMVIGLVALALLAGGF